MGQAGSSNRRDASPVALRPWPGERKDAGMSVSVSTAPEIIPQGEWPVLPLGMKFRWSR